MVPRFIAPDLLFSYWIYAWFLVFILGQWISKKGWSSLVPNPLFIFWLALLENIVTWILLSYTLLDKGSNEKVKTILLYAFVVILIKGVPIYMMSQYPIQFWPSIGASILLFLFYCMYLWFRQTNLIEIYRATYVSIKRGDNQTPMFSALSWLGAA